MRHRDRLGGTRSAGEIHAEQPQARAAARTLARSAGRGRLRRSGGRPASGSPRIGERVRPARTLRDAPGRRALRSLAAHRGTPRRARGGCTGRTL
ncbi:MAG: hypothetical protein ACK559_13605, partial [bacterium]